MASILFVRVSSKLKPEEIERIAAVRRPNFQEIPGLIQKVYGRDDRTGDVCGIYFFESDEALAAFRRSDLAKTIAAAYEAVEVRPEVYSVLFSLWPDRGPFEEGGSA